LIIFPPGVIKPLTRSKELEFVVMDREEALAFEQD
jgi:hypothetical protein